MSPASGSQGTRQRGIAVPFALSAAAIVLFTAAPLIAALSAGAIANSLGCELNEGGASPCLIGGTDIGEALSFLFVSGWFMFFTIPLGIGAVLIWCIALATVLILRFTRRNS